MRAPAVSGAGTVRLCTLKVLQDLGEQEGSVGYDQGRPERLHVPLGWFLNTGVLAAAKALQELWLKPPTVREATNT